MACNQNLINSGQWFVDIDIEMIKSIELIKSSLYRAILKHDFTMITYWDLIA